MTKASPRRLWYALSLALTWSVQAQETSLPAPPPTPPAVTPSPVTPASPADPLPALRQELPLSVPLPGVTLPLTPSPGELPVLEPSGVKLPFPALSGKLVLEVSGAAVRGLWVDAFGPGLKTRVQVQQTVDDAVALGVNTLFVQAIRRGDCLCMKSGLPLITDAALEKNFDPLAVITRLAHGRGLKVIAWASVTGVANAAVPSNAPGHVMKTHGPDSGAQSWLARRADGSWLEGRDGWLDAGIPEAADFMAQSVAHLVRNYPVDGVQLDRIRYPDGGNWGYDPKTLARYRAETGDPATPAASDPRWQAWKREQVTALVRRIALEVKSVRPDAWISAATITYGVPPAPGDLAAFAKSRTMTDVYQDWPTWVQQGLIELNVPMNYKRDALPEQRAWFDGWNAFAASVRPRADGQGSALAVGTALYLNAPAQSAAQAGRTAQAGLGWVGYSYRTPTLGVYEGKEGTAQGLKLVGEALRASPATLPADLRWNEPAPSARGLLGRIDAEVPGAQVVTAWQGGREVAQVKTDGNGYYGFLILPAGRTELRVGGQSWTVTIPERGVVRVPDLLLRPLPTSAAAAVSVPVPLGPAVSPAHPPAVKPK